MFELIPDAGGRWNERVLHNFAGADGGWPVGRLILDAAGNLYGMTNGGGALGWGPAFELMHGVGGGWGEKVLYNFNQSGPSGAVPYAGLIFDAAGNLYGTTSVYGLAGYGTAFKLTPIATGHWKETPLHSFGSNPREATLKETQAQLGLWEAPTRCPRR